LFDSDAREGCRQVAQAILLCYDCCTLTVCALLQSIQVSVNVLAKLASLNKIDAAVFKQSWVPILVQLWAMQDRAVRTVMLQTLKALVPYIPDATVNRGVFDNVLSGFADDNAKYAITTYTALC
jgi:hypothetical protein